MGEIWNLEDTYKTHLNIMYNAAMKIIVNNGGANWVVGFIQSSSSEIQRWQRRGKSSMRTFSD